MSNSISTTSDYRVGVDDGEKPLRNCDVGDLTEQNKRYLEYCDKHKCSECPCSNRISGVGNCALVWANMPYEEGGAE